MQLDSLNESGLRTSLFEGCNLRPKASIRPCLEGPEDLLLAGNRREPVQSEVLLRNHGLDLRLILIVTNRLS